jgi:hypothetical protein
MVSCHGNGMGGSKTVKMVSFRGGGGPVNILEPSAVFQIPIINQEVEESSKEEEEELKYQTTREDGNKFVSYSSDGGMMFSTM